MVVKIVIFMVASCLSAASQAAVKRSAGTFVFLQPEKSSFWHTATNSTMSVPVDFPKGVTSARLEVAAPGYEKSYAINESGMFEFSLPAATAPRDENVYDLTLIFSDNTERHARLALVQGLAAGAAGSTRCLAPDYGRRWSKVSNRAVMPVPYGVEEVFVNGVGKDTGLGGAQGWYAVELGSGESADVSLVSGESSDAVPLLGAYDGLKIIAK